MTKEFSLNSWSKAVMKECAVVNPQTLYALEKTGIWGEVVRQRKPIIVNEFMQPHPLKKGYPEGHVALRKFMSIPVMQSDKIIAVVGLGNKEADYTDNDVFQLTVLMNGVWANIRRRETQNSMNYERQKYWETLRSIGDAVLVINAKLQIEMLNPVCEQLTGWNEADAIGKVYSAVFNITHSDPAKPLIDPIVQCFQTKQSQRMAENTVLHSKDGKIYTIEDTTAPIFDAEGAISGVVLVFRDITEKQMQQQKILYASFHDTLTGLYNRNFFEQYTKTKIADADYPLAVMMTDVNGLKFTNDVFGHAIGDRLLQKAAEVVRDVLPKNAIISRYGGDEFIILVPATNRRKAGQYAEAMTRKFETYEYNGLLGSISIGFEFLTTGNQRIADVISDAESFMYKQKVLDRDKYKREIVARLMKKLHTDLSWEKAHSDNVSRLAYAFAEFIGLPKTDAEKARRIGYYHDIGKIGIEDKSLFSAPGKLTKDAWIQVKTHPLISFRILNASDDFVDIADLVLAHHERWGGKGYPKGMRESEIPLLARLIHLIGAYDVMKSHPVYLGAQPKVDIDAELEKNSGKQFDPELVRQFTDFLHQHLEAAGTDA
ncbi:MAG: diguanylate cyclase [bacterium]